MSKLQQIILHSLFLLTCLIYVEQVGCIYMDQVGKFDWRRQFIGLPKFVYHHPGSDNLIIGTHSNVVASVQTKDGSIIWRQLLPEGCNLEHMSILKSSEDFRDHLVRTSCSSKTANHSQFWSPQNGLLVSANRYREFVEDDQAESLTVDKGQLVGNSLEFSTDQSSLLVDEDGRVTFQVRSEALWSREESLASIVAVDVVQLPANMRDSFGMKKMIVALTSSGKIFGMDTISGDISWSLFETDLAINSPQSNYATMTLTQQSDKDASNFRAVVVHPNGLIVSLNPINGELIEKKKLANKIKQFALTEIDVGNLDRALIILDHGDNVHVYPDNLIGRVKSNIEKYYMTVVDVSPPVLTGYKFILSSDSIESAEIWSFPINNSEKIVDLSIKRIDEEIHSPARVLGDRGILYKYVNPNLITVMTEGSTDDTCNPDQSINIYLIDGVTGALVHNIHHPKSRAPCKMVLSENWLVYSYYNVKNRRTEISSLEMFEGNQQANSSAFSSLIRSHIKPELIEHKSFIFPSGIYAMVDTVTLRAMTNRHIIVALPSGGLLEIPKIFLDPRRPINMTMEHREEGLIPYMPELPIPSESLLNYDQTLLAVRRIVTSPAILESTSLVFAYGLDLFFTRVTPSKTFDILQEDFDHLLISAVLVFLVVASFASKHLAQRKALRAAWK